MNRRKNIIIGFALLMILFVAGTGCRIRHSAFMKSDRVKHAGRVVKMISKKLDLTDGQKEKLESIKDEILEMHASRAEIRSHRRAEVTALIRSESLDSGLLLEKIEAYQEDRDQVRRFMVEKMIDFHAMLTPGQRNRLAEHMDAFHDKAGHP